MAEKMIAASCLLALPLSVAAVDRSNSFTLTQDSAQDAWVVTCSIGAKGIDASRAYRGYFQVWYDASGTVNWLAYVPFELSPSAKRFKEVSPGIYSASGRLTKDSIEVSIQVTRYGSLQVYVYGARQDETGKFGCNTNIVEGTGTSYNVIHSWNGEQNVYFYRVGTGM